jgi:uncharacterized protein YggU (UPF0235/DUF167 family)
MDRERAKLIRVRVKPRSSVSAFEQSDDGSYVARLKSAPVDGEANKELVALVARHFGCSRSAISIKSGATARTKLLTIENH